MYNATVGDISIGLSTLKELQCHNIKKDARYVRQVAFNHALAGIAEVLCEADEVLQISNIGIWNERLAATQVKRSHLPDETLHTPSIYSLSVMSGGSHD